MRYQTHHLSIKEFGLRSHEGTRARHTPGDCLGQGAAVAGGGAMSKVSDASLVLPASFRLSPHSLSLGPPIHVTTSAPVMANSAVVYELVPLHELPILDPTKTIKSLLFAATQLSVVNRIGYRGRLWFSVMFLVGNLLTFATVAMPARIGQWLSVLAVILQLPGVFFTTIAIRYEMLRLLVRTYDFWFFTAANLMFTVSFVVLLGDWRILALLNGAYLIQIGIIADAQLGNLRALVVSAQLNIVCHVVLFSLVLFHFVDESKCVIMFRYSCQANAITTQDMLLNSMGNMIVLFTRLWYRKRAAMKEQAVASENRNDTTGTNAFSVNTKCVSYRCHIRLQMKETNSSFTTQVHSIVPAPSSALHGSESGSFSLAVQLQYSNVPQAFDPDDTIIARLSCDLLRIRRLNNSDNDQIGAAARNRRQWRRRILLGMLYTCGVVGVTSHAVLWITSWFRIPWNTGMLQVLSVGGSMIFCWTFFVFHQVRLVLQLYKSFDFVFLTAKVLTGHFCALGLLQWEHKFFTLGTSFMWMYWLLSIDAVTPAVRKWLAFRIQYAGVVAVGVITVQVMFALDLFWLDLIAASDFVLFRGKIFGRSIEIHAMSVFMSQLWTILAWFCRILWRIVRISGDDEMVMLLGQVGYNNYMYERKRRSRRAHLIKRRLAAIHSRSINFSRRISVKPAPTAE